MVGVSERFTDLDVDPVTLAPRLLGQRLVRVVNGERLAGTIVDGLARDIDESRELAYPVFARAATPSTARGRVVEEDWNGPVTVGDIGVEPGDLVIADGSGVVFISASRVEDVLDAAEALAAREAAMTQAVKDGKPVSEVMGGDYEKMLGDSDG